MAAHIIQSLTTLLLIGALLFPVFSTPTFARRSTARDALVGLIFGIGIIALLQSAHILPGGGMVDAKAGALIFGGFLGGPLGGAIVAICGLIPRVIVGEQLMPVGIATIIAYAVAGVALSRLHRGRNWPPLPSAVLLQSLAAMLVIQTASIAVSFASGLMPPSDTPVLNVAAYYVVSTLSVILTWAVITQTASIAARVRENGILLRRLQLAMDHNGMGIFTHDAATDTVMIDQGIIDILGLDGVPGPRAPEVLERVIHEEDVASTLERRRLALANQDPGSAFVFRAYHSDGRLLYLRVAASVDDSGPDGNPMVTYVLSDISDVFQARADRAEAVERIAAVAEHLPGVIGQVHWQDGETRAIEYLSPKCIDFWEFTAEEIIANPGLLPIGLHPEEAARHTAAIEAGIRTGQPITVRLRHRKGDEVMWLDFHAAAAPRAGGGHRIVGIAIDVTAEVSALTEAERQRGMAYRAQKNEAIGKLTGGVAHDFNNMLAVIMGNLELLREEVSDPVQIGMIDSGLEASRRGASLTRSLLAFAHQSRLEPEAIDLNTVALQSKNWMRRALPASIEIETSLLAGIWPIKADAASLESALLNLILNARDAMAGQGRLTIETANIRIDQAYADSRGVEIAPGRYGMLAVSDNGTGIDAATLAQIFDPFFTTKPRGTGSGVGLSMVKGFIEQSGGTVQVYSEPGTGTTFKLYFPATDAPIRNPSPLRAEDDASAVSGFKVLLAEDEESVRAMLVATLSSAGYDVTAVASGDAALEAFERDPSFDLVVTDIVMPGTLQGTGLAKALRARRADVPFIFMSGYAAEATVHGNGLRPEDIRLMKPVPKDDLLAAMRKATGTGSQ